MEKNTYTLTELLATNLDQHFMQLAQTYQDALYTFALRLCKRSEDAEDVVQEALMRSYIALTQYPAEHIRTLQLRSWLYKLTLNVFRNSQRYKRVPTASLYESDEQALLELPDHDVLQPESWLALQEQQAELEQALHRLTDNHREVIICTYFEQLSYQETASLLDITLGTVRSRLHRALKALRTILDTERTTHYGNA